QKHRFNEDRKLSASEDFELWLRLAARFRLQYTNTVTSLVVDHDFRSVRTIHGHKLIDRLNLLIQYLENDEMVQQSDNAQFNYARIDAKSYIAFHLAVNPADKKKCIHYLIESLELSPFFVKERRVFATIKNILSRW